MKRFLMALVMVAWCATTLSAQTVLVNETFDDYADTGALLSVWTPTVGTGNTTLDPSSIDYESGILTDDATTFPDIMGKAVDHIGATVSSPGMVNQFTPTTGGPFPGDEIFPTAQESIQLKADIFVGTSGNERMTVGLRSREPAANLIELGVYNTNSCDPTVDGCNPSASPIPAEMPGFYAGTGYAYRLQLFAGVGGDLLAQPNWQYFQLPIELDRPDDTDEIVSIADVGAGWHTYSALITPDAITLELDLFRDGLRNTSVTPDEITGIRPGTPGVDASQTWEITTGTQGYDSLRIGGPSGLSSAGAGAMGFDNIYLALVEALTPGNSADFNDDGAIDAADYTIWRDNLGLVGSATQAQGDANGDTNVDAADYAVWNSTYGTTPGSGSGLVVSSSVPEPTALVLALLGAIGIWVSGRRR